MRKLLPFLLLFPLTASAQEGTIRFDRVVRYSYELPPELESVRDQIPTQIVTPMVLLFDGSESLMRVAPSAADEEPHVMAQEIAARLRMSELRAGLRSDNETLREIHVRLADGAVAETRQFLGHTFLVTGTRPPFGWRLTGQQGEFLGYLVLNATAQRGPTTINAWFTPEIPISAGPGPYGGLPGMILVVSVDDDRLTYAATEVTLGEVEDWAIAAPEVGRHVSHEEYEQLVLAELREIDAAGLPQAGEPAVTADDIGAAPGRSIEEVLVSRFPSVQISRAPNGGITIRIRGSLSAEPPLYVIDGVPVEPGAGGSLDMINATDIESIRVLKDAASTTMYGVRGANGVILITTK